MADIIQPGTLFAGFLDSVYDGRKIRIVETGCMRDLSMVSEYSDGWSTLAIARWCKTHNASFHSVDLNIGAIELAHSALEAEGLSQFCEFHCQDSLKYLAAQTWIDFAFLDSCDGLAHGAEEFRLAASAGAKLIVLDDIPTKGAWAVKQARDLGWDVSFSDRYGALRRPT